MTLGGVIPGSLRIIANEPWENIPKNLNVPSVERLYEVHNHGPTTPIDWTTAVDNLVMIVRDAEAMKRRVRSFGAAFSMAPIAITTEHLVSTVFYNQVFAPFQSAQLQPNWTPERLVHAQAGARIANLHQELRLRNRSLPTVGSSDGQTIAGAVSTGTHGSGLLRGSIADYVRAIHLISEGGQQFWIERESEPVVVDSFPPSFGAQLRRNDDLFNAVVVGFGSFGLIHSLVLETVPIFALSRFRKQLPLDDKLRRVMRTLDFAQFDLPRAGTPYHFEVVVNPHDTTTAYMTTYYPADVSLAKPATFDADGQSLGDEIGRILSGIAQAVPATVPLFVPLLLKSVYGEADTIGTLGDLFRRTITPRYSPISTEIGVALQNAERALDVVIEVVESMKPQYAYPGIIGVRYVQKTPALLGFTQHDPMTCTLEVAGLGGVDGNDEFYDRLWTKLRVNGIPYTLHWGQLHEWTPDALRGAYGANVDAWVNARNAFLTSSGQRTFANDMLERYELTQS